MTTESFKELLSLGKWLNEVHGYHPTIIGGWAVFLYTHGLGSRDIDILFPDRKLKHIVLEGYLTTHGYKLSSDVFEKEFSKEVETSKRREKIYIDACSIEDINRLKGTNVVIPWELALKYSNSKRIEDVDFYIPAPEALILFKAKAALDREYDLRKRFDAFFLQNKIWKDYYDIISLLKWCEFDNNILRKLLEETNFRKYFNQVIENLKKKKDILTSLDVEWDKLKMKISFL